MSPGELAVAAAVGFLAVLFAIEIWAVRSGRPTISEWWQRLFARMDRQMVLGLGVLFGLIVGWFIAHFTSPPPG